jgi:hypothetical protein
MNNNYECMRCGYLTDRRSSIEYHISRKNQCKKKLQSFGYNENELKELSLIRKDDRVKNEVKCEYCDKSYANDYLLKEHIKNYCRKIDFPLSFDKEWNTDHIDIFVKKILVLSENKYTDLLRKVLENDLNLNVLIDKDIVYIYNFSNKYIKLDKRDLINMTMKKLFHELIKMKNEVLKTDKVMDVKSILKETIIINDKYEEYVKNEDIQETVASYIIDIYNSRKSDAYKFFVNLNISKINGY